MSYPFIDAVQHLTPHFTKDEWGKIYEKVGSRLQMGLLKKVFVILSDDDRLSVAGGGPSGANSISLPASSRGEGLRKRPADSDLGPGPHPTPSRSAKGRF